MSNGWSQSYSILQKIGHVGWYVIAYPLSFFIIRIKMAQIVDDNFALVEDDVSATTNLRGANSDNGNLPRVCVCVCVYSYIIPVVFISFFFFSMKFHECFFGWRASISIRATNKTSYFQAIRVFFIYFFFLGGGGGWGGGGFRFSFTQHMC